MPPKTLTYRKVAISTWDDDRFVALSDQGRCVWFWLLTGQQTTGLPGLILAGVFTIAEAMRREPAYVEAGLSELLRAGMIEVDAPRRLIRLPRAPEYNPPANPSIIVHWVKELARIPSCPLKRSHVAALRLTFHAKVFVDAWNAGGLDTVSDTVCDTVPDTTATGCTTSGLGSAAGSGSVIRIRTGESEGKEGLGQARKQSTGRKKLKPVPAYGTCPECGNDLRKVGTSPKGSHGAFLGCSAWDRGRGCRFTAPMPGSPPGELFTRVGSGATGRPGIAPARDSDHATRDTGIPGIEYIQPPDDETGPEGL